MHYWKRQWRFTLLLLSLIIMPAILIQVVSGDPVSFTEKGLYPGGATYAMAKSGTTLYTGTGTVVEIWDMAKSSVSPQNYIVWPGTNEIRPQKIGEIRLGDYAVGGLLISGNTLFIGSEHGLDVYNVANPKSPVFIASYDKGPFGSLRRVGNLLYASTDFYYYDGAGTHKLVILDVSKPAEIRELGSFTIPVSEGTLQRFEIDGNYAYLPVVYDIQPGYVFIVNVSNPKAPFEVTRITGSGYAGFSAVQVDKTRKILYALEYRSILHAYDISNPAKPVERGYLGTDRAEPLGQAADMKIRGNYAYVSTFYEGVRTFDISNPANMSLVAKGTTSSRFGYVFDTLLDGNYTYIANMGGGFSLFNVTNPKKISFVTQQDTHGLYYDVRVNGNYAYVTTDYEFMVFDISDPKNPVHTGSVEWARAGVGGVKGNYVFVDDAWRPLGIIDVSNPAKPVVAGQYSDHTKVGAIVGDTMYLGKKGQVQILDLSGLPAVSLKGTAKVTTAYEYPPCIAISGKYLYAGFGPDGVKILDVSDPAAVQEIGTFQKSDRPTRLVIRGNYLYVLSDYYLFTYDIADPANPVRTSQIPHDSWHTAGSYGIGRFMAYKNFLISGESKGIVAWDISSPDTPQAGVLSRLPVRSPGQISGYDFGAGGMIYSAVSSKGMAVFSVQTGNQPPVFTVIGNRTVDENTLLTFTVTATDANGDTLTYSALNLPANATFDAQARTFSWTPGYDQAGNYPVIFRVSDGALQDEETMTIIVRNINRAPTIAAIPAMTTTLGSSVGITINASDPDGDTLTYSALNLPLNSTFDAKTRRFSWTPGSDQVGAFTITFRASDGHLSASRTAAITVMNVKQSAGSTARAGFNKDLSANIR